MAVRLNAKGLGEFIRDHLLENPESRDYVGSMFQGYKEHLVGAGYKAPCAQTMHVYVWMLKEIGALVFDGAEPSGWDGAQPPPPGYLPACGSPAPQHYYRLVDPDHPGFRNLKTAWRQQRGLPAPPMRPPVQLPPVVTPITPAPPAPVRPPVSAPPPAPAPVGPPVVPSISLPGRFSTRSIPRVAAHLNVLSDLAQSADWPDQDWPELEAEVARVADAAGGWRDAAQEALDNEEARDAPREDGVEALGERVEELEAVVAALENQDLARPLGSGGPCDPKSLRPGLREGPPEPATDSPGRVPNPQEFFK